MDGSTTTSTVDVLGKWKSEFSNLFNSYQCENDDGNSSHNQVSDLNSSLNSKVLCLRTIFPYMKLQKPLTVLSEVRPAVSIIYLVKYCITILPFIFYTFYLTCALTNVLPLQYGGNV